MMLLIYLVCALPFLAIIAEIIVTWGYDETLMGTGYDIDPEGGEA